MGTPDLYLDLSADGMNPDGAVCDAAGNLWLAEWGASRVACHAPDGSLMSRPSRSAGAMPPARHSEGRTCAPSS